MKSLQVILVLLSVSVAVLYASVLRRQATVDIVDSLEAIRDNYGCDAVINSCGKKGKCCDVHDACYKQHGCTMISWIYLWGNCRQCNINVMACAVKLNPGKSSCCAAGNCGQPRPRIYGNLF